MEDSVRLLKRYKNRKIYDTKTNQYIPIAALLDIAAEEKVKVINFDDKEDVTSQVLSRAFSKKVQTMLSREDSLEYLLKLIKKVNKGGHNV